MDPLFDFDRQLTRRTLFGNLARGLGGLALGSLLPSQALRGGELDGPMGNMSPGPGYLPHFAPKAKRVIYLFQSGGPSHIDLYDYKPQMRQLHGVELPDSVRGGQRVTGMTAQQSKYPFAAPFTDFKRCGQHGTWISDYLPYTQKVADDITILRGMNTEAINHDPAVTYINTGSQQMGHASLGSWLSYGLGSGNEDLPAYMVLLSQGSGKNPGQPLFSRLWGNGYLPSSYQGVKLGSGGDPVYYLKNPPGIDRTQRRRALDRLETLNRAHAQDVGDPEIHARIDAYEMAYRMQTSVPELMNLDDEPESTFELYGEESRRPGSFAANCLMARRMAEKGVRFVQLFHRGWDQHKKLATQLPKQCMDVDQASAALIKDLKQRGLLDETLVIWGGEFGRTAYSQGKLGDENAGRDHHGRCFSIWMAGGGIKGGYEFGQTDEWAYNIVEGGVHIRDLNATILNRLGINHERFTFKFRGLNQRLTGVEKARVVDEILA
jgi:hypothetical protein